MIQNLYKKNLQGNGKMILMKPADREAEKARKFAVDSQINAKI